MGTSDDWWCYLQSDTISTELSNLKFPLSWECRNRAGNLVHANHALYQLSQSPDLMCKYAFILLLYNSSLINRTYSITMNQYSFHHPNDYSIYNTHSLNQPEIVSFYLSKYNHTDYSFSGNYTSFLSWKYSYSQLPALQTLHNKLNTHSCYKQYWGLINYVMHSF